MRELYRNPASGKLIDAGTEASLFWSGVTFAASVLLLNVAIPALNRETFGSSQFVGPLPVWVPFVLGPLVFVVLEARRLFQMERAVREKAYRCRACGHRWSAAASPGV
ncbi:MAG TPA: hypothetical protein VM409_08055 [Chloroflexia bacterium]|nr:hypothetical protein [Chloroflexia bacterium]